MDSLTLKNKVVVLTGATSGFGRGAGLRFAEAGCRLVLAARRSDLLSDVAAECSELGATAVPVPTDVSQAADVAELASLALREFHRIDVWINNAGAGAIGRFEDIPLDEHEQVLRTDLLGTLYGSYFAMQQFRKEGSGILINVASVLGKVPAPYYSSYSAAKHGVVGLTSAIRQELLLGEPGSIHVCTVLPTSTDTPFFEHAANYSGRELLPTPPVYEPEDVIEVIFKMATDPENEVHVGVAAKLAVTAHQFAPNITESKLGKRTHDTLEKAPPAEDDPGSLQEPNSSTGTVHSTATENRKRHEP